MRLPVTVGFQRLEERELAGRIPVHQEDPPESLSIQVAGYPVNSSGVNRYTIHASQNITFRVHLRRV